jgi:hypothetical protein
MAKVGCTIIVVGRMGTGKSPTIKDLWQQSGMKNKIVYDRRREYPDDWTRFLSLEKFQMKWTEFTDSFIVVEEATGFVNSFKEKELTDILIGIEHNRNILVFVFHSLTDTPPYIQRLARFMYLFPTNDNEKTIKTSRDELYFHFMAAGKKDSSTGYYIPEIIDLNEI